MKKPVNINEKTWAFLNKKLGTKDIQKTLDNPGKVLFELGFLNNPQLVVGTVIEMPNEIEYMITDQGAKQLAENNNNIELRTVYDPRLEMYPKDEVIKALVEGLIFDQVDSTQPA